MSSGGPEIVKKSGALWNRSGSQRMLTTDEPRVFLWKRANSQANVTASSDEQQGKQAGEEKIANESELAKQTEKGRTSSLWKRAGSQRKITTETSEDQAEKLTGVERPPTGRNQGEVVGRSKAIDFVKKLTRKASSRLKEPADPKTVEVYSSIESSNSFSLDEATREKRDVQPFSSRHPDGSQQLDMIPDNSLANIDTRYHPNDHGSNHEESWSKMSYRYDDETATIKTRETQMRLDDDETIKTRETFRTSTARTLRTTCSDSIPREISDEGTVTKKKKVKKRVEKSTAGSKSTQDGADSTTKKKLAKKLSTKNMDSPSVTSRKTAAAVEHSVQRGATDDSQDQRQKLTRLESERSKAVRRASSPHRRRSLSNVHKEDGATEDTMREKALRRAVSPGPRRGRNEAESDEVERATRRAASPHHRQRLLSEGAERDRALQRAVSPHRRTRDDEAERDRALGRSSSFRSCKKAPNDDAERDRAMTRSSSARRVRKAAESESVEDGEVERALERASSFTSRKKVSKDKSDGEKSVSRASSVRRPKKSGDASSNDEAERNKAFDRFRPKPTVDTDDSAPLKAARLERRESSRKKVERSSSAQPSSMDSESQSSLKNIKKKKAQAEVEYAFDAQGQRLDRPPRRSSLTQGANLYADAPKEHSFVTDRPPRRSSLSQGAYLYADGPTEYSYDGSKEQPCDRPARRSSLSQDQNFLNSPVKVVQRVGGEYMARRPSNEFEIQPVSQHGIQVRQQRRSSIDSQQRSSFVGSSHETTIPSKDATHGSQHFHSNGRRPSFSLNISDIEVSCSGITKSAAVASFNGTYQPLDKDNCSLYSEEYSQSGSPKRIQTGSPQRLSRSQIPQSSPRTGTPQRNPETLSSSRKYLSPSNQQKNVGDDDEGNFGEDSSNHRHEYTKEDVYYLDNGAPQLDIVNSPVPSPERLEVSKGVAIPRATSCRFGYSSLSSVTGDEEPSQPRASRRRSNECDYSSMNRKIDAQPPCPISDWKPLTAQVPPLHPGRQTSIEYKLRTIAGGSMYATVPDEPSLASDPEPYHHSIPPPPQHDVVTRTLSRGNSANSSSEDSFYEEEEEQMEAGDIRRLPQHGGLQLEHVLRTSPGNRDVSPLGAVAQSSPSNMPATNNTRCMDTLKEYTKDLDAGNTPRPGESDFRKRPQYGSSLTKLDQLLDLTGPNPKSPADTSVAELTITGLQLPAGPLTTVDESLEDAFSTASPSASPARSKQSLLRLPSPLRRNQNGLSPITETYSLTPRRRGPDAGDDEVDSVNCESQGQSPQKSMMSSVSNGNGGSGKDPFQELSRELREARERTHIARKEVRQLQKEIQGLQQKLGEAEQRKTYVQESLVRRKYTS